MQTNKRSYHTLLSILGAYFLGLTSFAYALPSDKHQPIHISADTAQINEKTGTTTYTGNVLMKQGSMEIKAARIDLYREKDSVSRIIANGAPANFRQQAAEDKPITDAFGEKLDYLIAKQTITITGNAKVQQESDQFTGSKIVYQMDKAIVNAYSGEGKTGQRVQMVIQPKAKP